MTQVCKVEKTRLTDGSLVYDVELSDDYGALRFACCTEYDADAFIDALGELLRTHTIEGVEFARNVRREYAMTCIVDYPSKKCVSLKR